MGLDVYLNKSRFSKNNQGEEEDVSTQIEEDSAKHPKHLFKVGYFRSSYNGGGLNRVLKNLGVPDLYDIFAVTEEGYYVKPNWVESLMRAEEAITKFDEAIALNGSVQVAEEWFFDWWKQGPSNGEEAMKVYLAELAEKKKANNFGFCAYSNQKGLFYLDAPLKVKAIIKGHSAFNLKKGAGKEPAVYVIFEEDSSWYRQALEIVVETCQYVLENDGTLEKGEEFCLHWSA